MSHEMKEKMKKLSQMKETLTCCMEAQLAKGVECIDTHEAGEVVDMIKDLAEAEEKCWKACYYKSIVEAMEEGEKSAEYANRLMMFDDGMIEHEMMGYNPNRGVSGRYTSSGGDRSGGRYGYPRNHWDSLYPPEMYPIMGYPNDNRNGNMNQNGSSDMNTNGNGNGNGRYGYPMDPEMERYGRPYNDYKMWKRNYTSSKSSTDKAEMDKHAMEHVRDTVGTMRDIWKDADPDLKRRMKTDLQGLVSEMN